MAPSHVFPGSAPAWLHDGQILKCSPQVSPDLRAICVSDLWSPQLKAWNEPLISSIFFPLEAKLILQTPLISSVNKDRLIWYPSANGMYSVKTTYHLVMSRMVDCSHPKMEGDWLLIWKMKVPPRVKISLWRACRNCLPTRVHLQSKGVSCPGTCVVCDIDMQKTFGISCLLAIKVLFTGLDKRFGSLSVLSCRHLSLLRKCASKLWLNWIQIIDVTLLWFSGQFGVGGTIFYGKIHLFVWPKYCLVQVPFFGTSSKQKALMIMWLRMDKGIL